MGLTFRHVMWPGYRAGRDNWSKTRAVLLACGIAIPAAHSGHCAPTGELQCLTISWPLSALARSSRRKGSWRLATTQWGRLQIVSLSLQLGYLTLSLRKACMPLNLCL
jgi:hypothetical protein